MKSVQSKSNISDTCAAELTYGFLERECFESFDQTSKYRLQQVVLPISTKSSSRHGSYFHVKLVN